MRLSARWLAVGFLLTFSVTIGKLYHGFTWTQWRALTRADQEVTDSTLADAKAYADTLDSIQQLTIDTLTARIDTLEAELDTALAYIDTFCFSGQIKLWYGSVGSIPAGWQLCDGTNGTPNLRDRFVVGAGLNYVVDSTGGAASHTHTIDSESEHTHGITYPEVPTGEVAEAYVGTQKILPIVTDAGSAHTHTESTESHLPPFYALCYIMKL